MIYSATSFNIKVYTDNRRIFSWRKRGTQNNPAFLEESVKSIKKYCVGLDWYIHIIIVAFSCFESIRAISGRSRVLESEVQRIIGILQLAKNCDFHDLESFLESKIAYFFWSEECASLRTQI